MEFSNRFLLRFCATVKDIVFLQFILCCIFSLFLDEGGTTKGEARLRDATNVSIK